MRINPICPKIGNFQKNICIHTKKQNHKQEILAKSPCVPNFYQAQNNISFGSRQQQLVFMPQFTKEGKPDGLVMLINITKDKNFPLKINQEDFQSLLMKPDGEINFEAVKNFTDLFKCKLIDRINKNKERIEFLENLANGTNSEIDEDEDIFDNDFDEQDDYEMAEDDYEEYEQLQQDLQDEQIRQELVEELAAKEADCNYGKDFLDSLTDEDFAQQIAQEMLDWHKKVTIKDISQIALDYTKDMFQLSKTPQGYDFSQMEKKDDLVKRIYDIEQSYQKSDVLEELIATSKRELGKVDINFIDNICTIIENEEVGINPVDVIGYQLAKYQAKDPIYEFEIAETMIEFARKLPIDDPNFETIFNCAFNPKTGAFDPNAAELLLEIQEETDAWGTKEITDYTSQYAFYKDAEEEIMLKYLYEIKDPATGLVKEDYIEPDEFVENIRKNYIFTKEKNED